MYYYIIHVTYLSCRAWYFVQFGPDSRDISCATWVRLLSQVLHMHAYYHDNQIHEPICNQSMNASTCITYLHVHLHWYNPGKYEYCNA